MPYLNSLNKKSRSRTPLTSQAGADFDASEAMAESQTMQGRQGIQNSSDVSRRDFLKKSGSALAILALMDSPLFAQMWGVSEGETVVAFLDQPPSPPAEVVAQFGELSKLKWPELNSWLTPNKDFFEVSHYNRPVIKAEDWRLNIGGLVKRPLKLTVNDIKARPRQDVVFTLECAGNNGFDWFVGGIGNAAWSGTALAPILQEAGLKQNAVDVVFFGADEGEEEVRGIKMPQNFSRSLSIDDATDPHILLCYEMNGEPLPHLHGFPVRLIVPGWYGVANVKWLKRIEVIDSRWAGRFMAKDYVTIREEPDPGGGTVWTQKVVGRSLPKSAPAKVTVKNGRYRIYGAGWGGSVQRVEVSIDHGPWIPAMIDQGQDQDFAWKFWHVDWDARPGDHTIVSRAIDKDGNIQPPMDDPRITNKHTYWESNGQITRRIRIS